MRGSLNRAWKYGVSCAMALLLAACGGGDSTTTTVSGTGLNSLGLSPAVATQFAQADNNLRVMVEDGPHGFQLSANANILYATVTVCIPGGNAANPADCKTIDHVQVDTGSVGLRVLASKVKGLPLQPIPSGTGNSWECFPFVIGGLWGQLTVADVALGRQTARSLRVQLIQDDPNAPIQTTPNCTSAADGNILSSDIALGSNGILGIGSTPLDCGSGCTTNTYANTFIQYYSCPSNAASSAACSAAGVAANEQVDNPIAALPAAYSNGVVLKMPAVTQPGAATASGELIFGINTTPNNTVPGNLTKVYLGMDYVNHPDSYLNITTNYGGRTFLSSYLDTGTNGIFFADNTISRCAGATWYCPKPNLKPTAVLSDGDNAASNTVNVLFDVANAEAMFSTQNSAFGGLAGAPPSAGSSAFAWGLPFFYGRTVYLSIWDWDAPLTGNRAVDYPWYAWTPVTP